MPHEIVGRDPELGAVRAFCGRSADGPAALVLEGEAGIGKSTLWHAGVEAARERGVRVLCARPAEVERGLALASLGDLLEPVLDEVLPTLPAPRRRALEAALLLAEPEGRLDPRTLAVAVRTALVELVSERPLLLAIDDVQWLDPSSAFALAFALRRVDGEPLLLLLARRAESGEDPSPLESVLEAERVEVGPLSLGAIQRVLQAKLGPTLPRPALLRVHETSGGNPFYALELARTLGPDADPIGVLPVPQTLDGLVRRRLKGLPEETREALILVSAAGRPRLALLAAAGVTEEALEPAYAADVLVREGGVLRLVHPLLGSVLQQGLTRDERRRVHRLIAGLVDDPLARARHLALAADAPEAGIAAELENAVATAIARGAPLLAAELGEHAVRLTPPEDEREVERRTISASLALAAAGGVARASALGREILARSPPGPRRAETLFLLGEVEGCAQADLARGYALFSQALAEAGEGDTLRARIHEKLADCARFTENLPVAETHAWKSLELARKTGDDMLQARALMILANIRHAAAKPDAFALVTEAVERADASGDAEAMIWSRITRAELLLSAERLDEMAAELDAIETRWRGYSEQASQHVFGRRSIREIDAGDLRAGLEYAEHFHEVALQYDAAQPVWDWPLAYHSGQRADFERARAIAGRGRTATIVARAASEAVLGCVELWSGDLEAAVEHFAEAERVRAEAGQREPHLYWWRGDYVEGLLELGRVEEAVAVLDAWEVEAVRLGRERILVQVLRCRGQVAAAGGEVGEALALLEEAAGRHEALGDRYQRGRALLALGAVRRRARQKRAAREAIEQALRLFEACGSEVLAARARGELGSIGGRRREEGLTAAERRVAALVAEGKTNREVAAALFLGERTVATHLSHVYAKLGVRSRTELARALR